MAYSSHDSGELIRTILVVVQSLARWFRCLKLGALQVITPQVANQLGITGQAHVVIPPAAPVHMLVAQASQNVA